MILTKSVSLIMKCIFDSLGSSTIKTIIFVGKKGINIAILKCQDLLYLPKSAMMKLPKDNAFFLHFEIRETGRCYFVLKTRYEWGS